ncbi:hypothetical protein HY630_03520 [Candidatus Uhrbacteria bacterium]|nr:hypothetical protein [Candidatus Uhrbacteria bacterium]
MRAQIKGATYEPQTPDEHIRGISLLLPVEERGGFVFLIAYVKKENADSELLLQTLTDQARRLAESFGKEANPQHRFEQFLGALNETLAEHVREGRWHVPIEQLHALVGIASSTEMYLSGTGELVALFLHKKPSQRYQIFNLFRGLQTEQSLPTWEKTFAVVLDGDFHPGDVFCVTDKDLQRTIPPDELNHILVSLPPTGAVEKIRQYFPHKEGLLLSIVKITEENAPQVVQGRSAIPQSNLSVEALNLTEETTGRLLDDQRPSLSIFLKKIAAFIRSKSEGRSRLLSDLRSQGGPKELVRRGLRIFLRLLGIVSKHTIKHTNRALRLLKNKEERGRVKTHLQLKQRHFQGSLRSLAGLVRTTPSSTKYLVGGIAIAAVVLVVGISVISKSQARAAEEEVYQEKLVSIEDLMERGAGAIIYKDENQARSLYLNAQTLIEALPTDTPERDERAQELALDLQTALNEIRHLVTIPNPPLLADLETLTDGVFGNGITIASGNILVAGSDGRLYQFNRTEKRFDVIAGLGEGTLVPIAMSQEDGRTYLLGADGQAYGVSFENQALNPLTQKDDRWVDLEAYANRLYFLRPTTESAEGQIVRFTRNGSSFDQETEWITSRTVPFDTIVSLAIDGSAYVLMHDGSVSRFTSGSEEGWGVGVVDPRITQATKVWTSTESRYLYVLEPATQRLVVYQKDSGAFLVQYRSDAFQNLTDFIVDEAGYTIYLLAGSKLYSIAPSHLE